jgi:hypothetical protein|tara:strand:+ start:186 stop:344 length:159 start_codon:yes stop_codon:yes gene_type:complete
MIWDLAITMMTEKAFWDTFQKKHNLRFLNAKKKTKEKKTKSKKKSGKRRAAK